MVGIASLNIAFFTTTKLVPNLIWSCSVDRGVNSDKTNLEMFYLALRTTQSVNSIVTQDRYTDVVRNVSISIRQSIKLLFLLTVLITLIHSRHK